MDGQELKQRRNKLGIVRRNFAVLLGVTADKIYRWETGRTRLPPNIEQTVENIKKKLNKHKSHSQ